jgi:integrase/recombinase XerD
MSPLRARMIRDMTLRGFSPRTHESYLAAVVGLARHYRRSPAEISSDEVQGYLAHLVQQRRLAWSTCALAAYAFRFLYHVTLGHPPTTFRVPAPRQPQRLPEILSRAEVWRLLDTCTRPKHHLVLATAYAAGLRVSELVALKTADFDPERMTIRVEQGKGPI